MKQNKGSTKKVTVKDVVNAVGKKPRGKNIDAATKKRKNIADTKEKTEARKNFRKTLRELTKRDK